MQTREVIKTSKPHPYVPKEQQHREKEKSWSRVDMKRQQQGQG